MPLRGHLASCMALVACAACGDSAAGPVDGGADGATTGDAGLPVAAPAPPAPAALPDLGPCPDGWEARTDGDVTVCEPWTSDWDPDTCGPWEMRAPGDPGCTRVGSACPPSGVPAGLPTDRAIVYVAEGAIGGDGSMASPFGSVVEGATAAAAMEGVVAVGRGTYDEEVRLATGTTLWGACVEDTLLTNSVPIPPPPAPGSAVVVAEGVRTEIRNLRIGDSARPGVRAPRDADVRLEDAVVVNARDIAALASDMGRVSAERVVIRNTAPSLDGTNGVGAQAQLGGIVELRLAVVLDNRSTGLGGAVGGSVRLEDSAVMRTAPEADGDRGMGVRIERGASGALVRSIVSESHLHAAGASGADTPLTLEDVVIRDTSPRMMDDRMGRGIEAQGGAPVDGMRITLERNHDIAVRLSGTQTVVRLADVVVRDTLPQVSDESFGRGLDGDLGGRVEVTRMLIEDSREGHVVLSREDTTLVAEDLVGRDALGRQSDLGGGRGITVQAGARAELSRVRLERGLEVALVVQDVGSVLAAMDVEIREGRSRIGDGLYGRGLEVGEAASAMVERVVIDDVRDAGVFVTDADTRLEASDLRISGGRSRTGDDRFGRAIGVQVGATAVLARVQVEDNQDLGLFVSRSTVEATDLVITGTLPQECAEAGSCVDAGHGSGLGSFDGSDGSGLTVRRFLVADSDLCGVQVARGASLDLQDGLVRGNLIGACVQVSDYDLSRLTDSVVYRDNGENLESTMLAVPESGDGLPIQPAP